MRYKGFQLTNYKGLGKIDIESDTSSPICLLGMNEAGKSTILEAINDIGRLCSGKKLLNGEKAIKPAIEFTDEVKLAVNVLFEPNEVDSINAGEEEGANEDTGSEGEEGEEGEEGDTNGEEQELINKIRMQVKECPEVKVSFIFPYENNKPQGMRVEVRCKGKRTNVERAAPVLEAIQKHCPEVIYHTDLFFSAPKIIRFASKKLQESDPNKVEEDRDLNSRINRVWQSTFSDILSGALYGKSTKKTWSFQEDVVDELANKELNEIDIVRRLSDMSEYLNNTITDQWMDINGRRTFDKIEIAPAVGDAGGFSDFQLNVTSKAIPFPLSDRSKGAQWYFCFKILTEVKSNRLGNGVIFLLDEPAHNLHISNQEKTYQTIRSLNDDEKISIVYATHSPELTGSTSEDLANTYLVVNKFLESKDKTSSGKIEVKKLSEVKKSLLRNQGHYAHAIAPLVHKVLAEDFKDKKGTKKGAYHLLEKLKNISSFDNMKMYFSGVRTLLQILNFLD